MQARSSSANDMPLCGVHIVIPSITRAASERVADSWVSWMVSDGATCAVVANSKSVSELRTRAGISVISAGENLGFSRAVNLGAGFRQDWDVLLVANDDIDLDRRAYVLLKKSLLRCSRSPESLVVSYDSESARRIPNSLDVWRNVSLTESVFRRAGEVMRFSGTRDSLLGRMTAVANGQYYSFSLVAISRRLWISLGGLSSDFCFCYEDADFVKRASESQGFLQLHCDIGARHLHSVSTKSHIARVLPVVTESAETYLRKSEVPVVSRKAILATSLVFRVCLIPVTSGNRRDHFRGALMSICGLFNRNMSARLPEYDRL